MYLSSVWIPAEDPVVFRTTKQKLRVSLAPGNGQNSPEKNTKLYSLFDGMTKKNGMSRTLLKNSPCVVLKNFQGRCGKTEVPHLDDRQSVIFRRQYQLSGHIRVPEHS